jgi:hypothetical protein
MASRQRGDILRARVCHEGGKFALIADDPAVYAAIRRFISGCLRSASRSSRRLVTDAWLAQAPKTRIKRFLNAT